MNFNDDNSNGVSALETINDDIYYNQLEQVLELLWKGGIRDVEPNKQMNEFLYKLAQLYLLQHYWRRSDILVNIEQAMGGASVIAQNTHGENIFDFYNAARTQLRPYIQDFINYNI